MGNFDAFSIVIVARKSGRVKKFRKFESNQWLGTRGTRRCDENPRFWGVPVGDRRLRPLFYSYPLAAYRRNPVFMEETRDLWKK